MPLTFLTPPVERLDSDGRIERLSDGGVLGRLRKPVLLLARDLCAFSLFEGGALTSRRRRQAAVLHARLASPYVVNGSILVKAGSDFGIWWWDLERIAAALAPHRGLSSLTIRPETLAQPPGRDWRVVALQNGYEAQLWRVKALVASAWRPTRFDATSWSGFTRLQRSVAEAPATPPAPSQLPIAFDAEAFGFGKAEVTNEQAVALGAGVFAFLAASTVAFLLGQGLQLSGAAQKIEAETAEIRAATPQSGDVQALETDRRVMAAYQEIEERTNPVSATGAAVGIVAFHDLLPTRLEADEETLTLTLPYSALTKADALIEEFAGSGYFFDVEPRTDAANANLILEMKIRPSAPPLSADG